VRSSRHEDALPSGAETGQSALTDDSWSGHTGLAAEHLMTDGAAGRRYGNPSAVTLPR
jgi:hypothetical protein